jgi:hypothetical protein
MAIVKEYSISPFHFEIVVVGITISSRIRDIPVLEQFCGCYLNHDLFHPCQILEGSNTVSTIPKKRCDIRRLFWGTNLTLRKIQEPKRRVLTLAAQSWLLLNETLEGTTMIRSTIQTSRAQHHSSTHPKI